MLIRTTRFRLLGFLFLVAFTSTNGHSLNAARLAGSAKNAVYLLEVFGESGNEVSSATGFLISQDGKLITNFHALAGGTTIWAIASNGVRYQVSGIYGYDKNSDLAILKIDGDRLPYLRLETIDPTIGEEIVVIGSPLGLQGTVSTGIVSGVRTHNSRSQLQITAPISPGSSGSPIINRNGRVIGIVTSSILAGQSINFAIPSKYIRNIECRQLRPLRSSFSLNVDELPFLTAHREAASRRDAPDALHSAERYVRAFPNSAQAHYSLARVCYQLHLANQSREWNEGDGGWIGPILCTLDDSIEHFEITIKLLQDEPHAPSAMSGVVLDFSYSLAHNGELDRAVDLVSRTIRNDPDNWRLWARLGDLRVYRPPPANYSEAVRAYERAFSVGDTSLYDVRMQLYRIGECYTKLERESEARSALAQLYEMNPLDAVDYDPDNPLHVSILDGSPSDWAEILRNLIEKQFAPPRDISKPVDNLRLIPTFDGKRSGQGIPVY